MSKLVPVPQVAMVAVPEVLGVHLKTFSGEPLLFAQPPVKVLAPLVVSMALHARYPEHDTWKTTLEKTSNIALVAALGMGIAVNWSLLTSSIGSWVIAASTVLALVYVAVGWAAGLGTRESEVTISMVSGMRFTPIRSSRVEQIE